jgi:dolichol-phosphate mannosyltransferase
MNYSVILPALNEFQNLKLLIPRLIKILPQNSEIIIIDDNSKDETFKKIKKKFLQKNVRIFLRKKNPGLALSIKKGINEAKGKFICVMDSDFNHQPSDLKKLIKIFSKNNFDLVCGSRYLNTKGFSIDRYGFSKVFNIITNIILGKIITDNLSGFFIIKKKILNKLNLKKIFYGYGDYYIRLLFICKLKNFQIKEVKITYGKRKGGVSKSNLIKLFFQYLYSTIQIKFEN